MHFVAIACVQDSMQAMSSCFGCIVKCLCNQCHAHRDFLYTYQCVHFSYFPDHLSDGNEWNPDIISGVVRPPEQIKLVHGIEAIRSVSSSSSSSGKQ